MKTKIEFRSIVKDCGSFCILPTIIINRKYENSIDIAFLAWTMTIKK